MGKVCRLLSVVLCAVLAVFLSSCQTVFAVSGNTNEYNKYGKVSGYGGFYCTKIDDTTTHIYLDPVLENTSTKHIKSATITVEFVNVAEFPNPSYYEPVAVLTAVVKNIGVGREKRFKILEDITVKDAADRLDVLAESDTLHAYFHKIQWEVSDARPTADTDSRDRYFV